MSHTGVHGAVRLLTACIPLRHDTPPSAIGMMRDAVSDNLVGRLGCVVNNALQFVHAVAVYRLRAMVVTLQRGNAPSVQPLAVSLMVNGAAGRAPLMSVTVIADLDVTMAMVAQRMHTYWCWQLHQLLEMGWGAPTENHHLPPSVSGTDADDLARCLAQRSQVPHCASLPWHRVHCGFPCWIQGGQIMVRQPADARGVILRGGSRADLVRVVLGMLRRMGATDVLVVTPSPVLRQWWTAAVAAAGADRAGGIRFRCWLAHAMLDSAVLSESSSVVVWDAVQPFPMNCTIHRPAAGFSLVLAPPQGCAAATRTEHTLCRLLGGMPQCQIQAMLVPPASAVVHRADEGDGAGAGAGAAVGQVHACEVDLPDDLRALVQQLARPDVHATAVTDNTAFVAAKKHRQGLMFGTALSPQDAAPTDAGLACPMCEIEDACGDWPLLRLDGCGHAVCLRHFTQWPHQCAVCRAPVRRPLHELDVIRRTGSKVAAAGSGSLLVVPADLQAQLDAAVAHHWQPPSLPPKLERCVNDAANRYEAGGGNAAVLVVAAHDAAVVAIADALREKRGVPAHAWLGVADAVPGEPGGPFVLCLAQRMVCAAARLAWVMPWADGVAPHAVCASSTVPVLSLVRMLGGCAGGDGTVTYVVYRDTPEARDLEHRIAEFRHACPEMGGRVGVV